MQTADTRTVLCGIELDNPVIPASGTFGFGYEFAALYDINCLGTFSFKGTTREARFGNPTPRIADCTAGMINAVGLQNPGVDDVIAQELPRLRACFRKPVMANVSGFSVEEYAYTCERLGREPQVGWLEVNVSCPNVHGGGMSFGTDPAAAASVVRAVRAVTDKPLLVPQCDRHCNDRQSLRGGGRGRHQPHQYPFGYAHRQAHPPPRACQPDGRILRTSHFPGGVAHGLSGRGRGRHPRCGYGRRLLRL